MKKEFVILLTLCLLFLNLFIISVHAVLEDAGEGLEKNVEDIENTKANIETKWDYLGKEWQSILLKNKIVSGLDGFCKKISIVFEILFAEPYSLSLTLFMIIILWVYFLFQFSEILRDFSAFSSGTSKIIGFGLAVVLAQTGIIKKIVTFFGWLVFKPEAWWARWIIIIILAFILFLIYKVSSMFGDAVKKSKEQLEKEQEKTDRKTLRAYVNAIVKAFKD